MNKLYKVLYFLAIVLFIIIFQVKGQEPLIETVIQTGHYATISSVAYSNNGRYVLTGSKDKTIKLWNAINSKEIRSYIGSNGSITYLEFDKTDTYFLSVGLNGKVIIWDVVTSKLLKEFSDIDDNLICASFSPDGKQLVTGSEKSYIKLWDIETGKLIREIKAIPKDISTSKGFEYKGAGTVHFSSDGKYILAGTYDKTAIVWDTKEGKLLKTFAGHKGGVGAINITPDAKYIISGGRDGTIRTWDVEKGKEIISQSFINENDWFTKSPEGYFDASEGAYNSISFVKGTDIYSIDQFFNEFYIPGLYHELINDNKEEMRNNLINQIDGYPPPSVEIISPEQNSNFDNNNLIILMKITNNGGGVSELKVMHNGKRLDVDFEDLKRMKKEGQYLMKTLNIQLIPGKNEFSISAFSDGMIESNTGVINLIYQGIPKSSACYFLSIGINKYENSMLDLSYAKPDAKAVVDIMEQKGNKIFKEVKIYEIYDSKATKENIFNTLDVISAEIKKEDVFVMFYAGHGSMVNDVFYFITAENTSLYQEGKLKNAMDVNELQEKLKELSALKQVVFLDACHSGTSIDVLAMRGASEEKALAQLSRSSGIHVFASAGKEQQAAEINSLGHGVFTYVLLEALNGKADGTPKDSKITVYELKSYLDDQVPEISFRLIGHKQYPSTFSIGHDFPLVFE